MEERYATSVTTFKKLLKTCEHVSIFLWKLLLLLSLSLLLRSIAILSIASSNCDNFHNFPLKIELFETHVARLLLFDITLHDFQNLVKIIRF